MTIIPEPSSARIASDGTEVERVITGTTPEADSTSHNGD